MNEPIIWRGIVAPGTQKPHTIIGRTAKTDVIVGIIDVGQHPSITYCDGKQADIEPTATMGMVKAVLVEYADKHLPDLSGLDNIEKFLIAAPVLAKKLKVTSTFIHQQCWKGNLTPRKIPELGDTVTLIVKDALYHRFIRARRKKK